MLWLAIGRKQSVVDLQTTPGPDTSFRLHPAGAGYGRLGFWHQMVPLSPAANGFDAEAIMAGPLPAANRDGQMKDELRKRFESEIQRLERELKSELPKEIKIARELGDLRENAEYQAAKERQVLVQARLAMLHKRVAELALINLDRIPDDRAAFGSTVDLQELGGEKVIYRLVMPEDADPTKGWISIASPIGRALMGKEEGDEVAVPTPGGVREFELVKLVTIHGK